MDVLHLIDRLEALITDGVRVPMTSKVIVDEHEFLEILDQLMVAIPEEIKQAKRLNVEKERVIGGAKSEAEKIIVTAQERAAVMLKDNEVVKLAEQRAEAIIAEAERSAEEIRNGADAYAIEVLTGLENELNRLVAQARKGRATLEKTAKETAALRERQNNHAYSPPSAPQGRNVVSERRIIDDLAD